MLKIKIHILERNPNSYKNKRKLQRINQKMGKKQHQSDKLYLTTTEWKTYYGGHKDDTQTKLLKAKFKRLPFTHCALSLLPWEDPIASQEGVIFDLTYIIPFLRKYGINPVNGKKITSKDLIQLKFQKNKEGEFHCPVTFKTFTENSHIVFIRTTGNVFAWEAVDELNIKPKFWKDLLTDDPFTRKDIITIQDPGDINKYNIASFHHIKMNLKAIGEEEQAASSKQYINKMNSETRETLKQLEKDYKPTEKKDSGLAKADGVNAAHYSTGQVAAGFTSTVMPNLTQHEAAVIDEDVLRYARIRKKAYVRMITSEGQLNIELHADLVPKTVENFLKHCKNGYYNDTKFHRIVKNFMVQGGDPTGTGRGGESIWGEPFKDEFKDSLTHSGRGVLSMANSGADTNKSQFFITFRSCKQLDRKHTVFGRVVGGLDTVTNIESTADKNPRSDVPTRELKIINCQVFVDPYEEADEMLAKEREDFKAKEGKKDTPIDYSKLTDGPKKLKSYKTSGEIGKYINPKSVPANQEKLSLESGKRPGTSSSSGSSADIPQVKKKKSKLIASKSTLNDFSAW